MFVPKGHILLVTNRVVAGACDTAKFAASISPPDILRKDEEDECDNQPRLLLGAECGTKAETGRVEAVAVHKKQANEATTREGARRDNPNAVLLLLEALAWPLVMVSYRRFLCEAPLKLMMQTLYYSFRYGSNAMFYSTCYLLYLSASLQRRWCRDVQYSTVQSVRLVRKLSKTTVRTV